MRIVENGGRTEGEPWRVLPTPTLQIGNEGGPEAYRFSGISGLLRRRDGGFIVADQSNTLRFYDSRGVYQSSRGGPGSGPGEFNTISLLRRFGEDSLIVWDFGLRRATILSGTGEPGRTVRGPSIAGFFFVTDAFSDGALLGISEAGVDLRGLTPGIFRSAWQFVRFDVHRSSLDTILTLDGPASMVRGGAHPTMVMIPFSASPVTAAAGSGFYCGTAESFEVKRYGSDGKPLMILRMARPNPPVTPGLKDTFVANLAARQRNDASRLRLEREYGELPFPTQLPAYQRFVVDAVGDLWVASYAALEGQATRWAIFAPSGRFVADVTTPAGLTVFEIGSDYILGVSEDSLDVERIMMLELRRRDAGGLSVRAPRAGG